MGSASAQNPPVGPALREAKRHLREATQAARDGMSATERDAASHAIVARLAALPSFAPARVIAVTMPFRSEWDSRLLARIAMDAGKTVVSPRVNPATRMLSLHRIGDLARDFVPGYRDIPEPGPHCDDVAVDAVDWVLVPGVAFDDRGHRLGYGGGYYDRLFPLLPRDAVRVAGAFDVQVVALVPTGPHDLRVDCIATETRVIFVDDGAAP